MTQEELAALSEAARGANSRMDEHKAFREALVELYRAGQLVLIGPDAVEDVARAIEKHMDRDWNWTKKTLATAALAALKGEG